MKIKNMSAKGRSPFGRKYKALILDIDGTLSHYSIEHLPNLPTKKVSQAIKKAQKHGVFVNLATSRPLARVKHILKHLDLKGYSILIDGAQIIDPQSLQTVWQKPISQKSAETIYHIGRRYKVKTYYNNFYDDLLLTSSKQLKSNPVGDLYFDDVPTVKLKNIQTDLARLKDVVTHEVYSVKKNYHILVMNDIKATKQHALIHVIKILKMKPAQIIGVGDGYNDYPLLMGCGLKIAMGNAVPELKAIADFIAPSVEEDGVATVIEKFILNQ